MSDPNKDALTKEPWPPAPMGSSNDSAAPPVRRSSARANALDVVQGAGLGIAAGILFPLLVAMAATFFNLLRMRYGYAVFVLPLAPDFFIARWLYGKRQNLGWAFGIVSIGLSVLVGGTLALFISLASHFTDL